MDRITESDIYAELVNAHRRPLPVQPGDITIYQFAKDIGATYDVARSDLEREANAGRLVRVKRISDNNRQMMCYRLPDST